MALPSRFQSTSSRRPRTWPSWPRHLQGPAHLATLGELTPEGLRTAELYLEEFPRGKGPISPRYTGHGTRRSHLGMPAESSTCTKHGAVSGYDMYVRPGKFQDCSCLGGRQERDGSVAQGGPHGPPGHGHRCPRGAPPGSPPDCLRRIMRLLCRAAAAWREPVE